VSWVTSWPWLIMAMSSPMSLWPSSKIMRVQMIVIAFVDSERNIAPQHLKPASISTPAVFGLASTRTCGRLHERLCPASKTSAAFRQTAWRA